MATIREFKAVRPNSELVQKVAALPYDVMSSEEARVMVEGNPYSFLHVDKPEIDLAPTVDLYSEEVYLKAKSNIENMIKSKVLVQDDSEYLYIYKLTMNGRSQTGLVACASVDEYLNGTIKKHELTRKDKETDRINHIKYTNAQTGPIFMAYRENAEISSTIESFTEQNKPVYNFETDDSVGHTVWVIDDAAVISKLKQLFNNVSNLYIADGHHRNAAAVEVCAQKRLEQHTGDEQYNYYLAVMFPDSQLKILDYNRVVKDLNGLTEDELLNKIKQSFIVEEFDGSPKKPATFGMYINKKWYELTLKTEILNKIENGSIERLDVSILQDFVLTPILGITDNRTDKRIDFVGGIRGISELVSLVDSEKFKLAFSMFPTSMEELMHVADSDQIMPPKSTWFEPKLRSGIFIHQI